MPRFDGSGPNGVGPKTGRGLGYCYTNDGEANVNYDMYPNRGLGRGFRRGGGRGFGRGFGRGLAPISYNGVSEKTSLRHEKEVLEERLEYLNKTIDDMESQK